MIAPSCACHRSIRKGCYSWGNAADKQPTERTVYGEESRC
jgi:hypothetical protein